MQFDACVVEGGVLAAMMATALNFNGLLVHTAVFKLEYIPAAINTQDRGQMPRHFSNSRSRQPTTSHGISPCSEVKGTFLHRASLPRMNAECLHDASNADAPRLLTVMKGFSTAFGRQR